MVLVKGFPFGTGSLESESFMENASLSRELIMETVSCNGISLWEALAISLWKRLFVKGFTYGKGSFVKVIRFPYGKGSLQIKGSCSWKRLFVKESPFGEGSLQSYVFMEKALCKDISFWRRLFVKGFAY